MIFHFLSRIRNPHLLRLAAIAAMLITPLVAVLSIILGLLSYLRDFAVDTFNFVTVGIVEVYRDLFTMVRTGTFQP